MAPDLYDQLPPDRRQRTLAIAPVDIGDATRKAVGAGHGDAARAMLVAARGKRAGSSVAGRWPSVIDDALAVL